jgi:hypothetical protein
LIAAGTLTQAIGGVCLVLALASVPVAHDLRSGMSGVVASIVGALAAIVCGTLVWRGRLIPLALAAGLDVGFGIGLPRGGSAIGAMLRILPAEDVHAAETLIMIGAVLMFIAAAVCIAAVPTALRLRQWARDEIAKAAASSAFAASPAGVITPPPTFAVGTAPAGEPLDEVPTRERPRLERGSMPLPAPAPTQPPVGSPDPGGTLKGVGAIKLMPTQVIRVDAPGRGKPFVIVGVAVTLIAIGIIVITAATRGSKEHDQAVAMATGSSRTILGGSDDEPAASTPPGPAAAADAAAATAPPADAASAAAPVEDFVPRFHTALQAATAADLGALFDTNAFAFGVEAHDLAEGRDAVVAQLREDVGEAPAKGFEVAAKFTQLASDGDVGWLAEELKVGTKTFVITAVLGRTAGTWTIGALHWAQAMPNDMAYRMARDGDLAVPDAIPDAHDDSALATAMRTAFASRPSFVDARSTRADAFNFGSASGERLKGGEAIKKVFGRIKATIRLHDSVKVGMLGDRGGWGVANVDFTDADKDGTEVTQTFRVLAAWVKEDAGWRIVQTQWSNAR